MAKFVTELATEECPPKKKTTLNQHGLTHLEFYLIIQWLILSLSSFQRETIPFSQATNFKGSYTSVGEILQRSVPGSFLQRRCQIVSGLKEPQWSADNSEIRSNYISLD